MYPGLFSFLLETEQRCLFFVEDKFSRTRRTSIDRSIVNTIALTKKVPLVNQQRIRVFPHLTIPLLRPCHVSIFCDFNPQRSPAKLTQRNFIAYGLNEVGLTWTEKRARKFCHTFNTARAGMMRLGRAGLVSLDWGIRALCQGRCCEWSCRGFCVVAGLQRWSSRFLIVNRSSGWYIWCGGETAWRTLWLQNKPYLWPPSSPRLLFWHVFIALTCLALNWDLFSQEWSIFQSLVGLKTALIRLCFDQSCQKDPRSHNSLSSLWLEVLEISWHPQPELIPHIFICFSIIPWRLPFVVFLPVWKLSKQNHVNFDLPQQHTCTLVTVWSIKSGFYPLSITTRKRCVFQSTLSGSIKALGGTETGVPREMKRIITDLFVLRIIFTLHPEGSWKIFLSSDRSCQFLCRELAVKPLVLFKEIPVLTVTMSCCEVGFSDLSKAQSTPGRT